MCTPRTRGQWGGAHTAHCGKRKLAPSRYLLTSALAQVGAWALSYVLSLELTSLTGPRVEQSPSDELRKREGASGKCS